MTNQNNIKPTTKLITYKTEKKALFNIEINIKINKKIQIYLIIINFRTNINLK